MKNTIRLGVPVIAAAALLSCGDAPGGSITLSAFHGVVVSEEACVPSADPETGAVFDAGVSKRVGRPGKEGGYTVYVKIENNLPSNEDKTAGRLNSNKFEVEEIELSFDNSGIWSMLPAKRTVSTGILLDSGGKLLEPVLILDQPLADLIVGEGSPIPEAGDRADLRVRVKAKGHLLDGSEVETNTLARTITVCRDCLIESIWLDETGNELFSVCSNGQEPTAGCSVAQSDGFTCEEEPVDPGTGGSGGEGGSGGGGAGGTAGEGGTGGGGAGGGGAGGTAGGGGAGGTPAL